MATPNLMSFPIQTVLFFLESKEEALVPRMREAVVDLADQRDWVLGKPCFVDRTDPPEREGDLPIRTVGGVFEIHARRSKDGRLLPREVDARHFEEVSTVVAAMRALSELFGAEIGFEVADERVGAIRAGRASRFLAEAWLAPWRAEISGSDAASGSRASLDAADPERS